MKYNLLFIALFSLSINMTHAQEIRVSGKVSEAGSGSLPGVNVQVKGTTQGTVTDIDGSYSVSVGSDATLIFSFIGYVTEEIKVGNQTTINLEMSSDVTQLSEIVVIGYGEVQKKDATGSIVSVSSSDFNKGAISSPQELLMGKASGVVITAPTGQPGGGSTIRIRGGSSLSASNDPLIVVDGIPLENSGISGMANPLSTINPNDIESFSILKDASATAIYGSRGSNGVIIITTKQGTTGKMKVSYNGNISIGVPVKTLEVYNGDEYRALFQSKVDSGDIPASALTELGTANTDWQDEIYQNAVSTDHNISVSGSKGNVPYRVSIGYLNQNGLLKNSKIDRTSFNVSASPSMLNDDLKISLNAKGSFVANDFSNTDAIGNAVRFDPTQPVQNGNTRYGGYTSWTTLGTDPLEGSPNNIATQNPVALLKYRDNTSDVQRYILGAKFDYSLPYVEGLKATLNLGYDYYISEGMDESDTLGAWTAREPAQQHKEYEQTKKNSLLDFYLNYTKEFGGNHKVDLTGGYSYQHFYNEGENSYRPNFATSEVFVGADTTSYKNEYFLVSFFGRLNYTFKERYLLTATLRNDGSSRFSEDNRWGLFPAVALAWKINEESFMSDLDFFDDLKLRMGWGRTGQQDIGTNYYPYIPAYTISQQGAYYQFGNTFYPTQRPDAYDPGITWETTTTQNIGLDFSILRGRISGALDLYKRTTDDLLNQIPIAAGTNFSNFLTTNVGSLENKGYEISLTGAIISKPDLTWEVSGNFTSNRNKITKLTLVDDPDYLGYNTGGIAGGVGNTVQINSVGHPANSFFLLNQIYDVNGNPIEGLYTDRSGEGGSVSGNEANKYYLKKPAPDYLIGLSSRVVYKNVDFAFSGRVNIGNYVYNNNASNMALYQNLYNQSGYTANVLKSVTDTNFKNAQYFSDFYLENASFFRMDNMSVGYSFSKLVSEKVSGRVAFTVQNAFVITKYSGIDPEVDGGIDNALFPRPRTFMLGFSLNF